MQAYILRASPGSRFHFGEALGAYTEEQSNAQKTTSEYLHSDTLWSALVNAWAFCHPDSVEDFIDECRKGHFKLSSAFYCVEYPNTDTQVFFLPKPVSLNLFQFEEPKKLKKIKFISKGVWESGLLPDDWFNPDKCTLLQKESIVALKSEIDMPIDIFKIETNPKVRARNMNDRDSSFFYQSDLFLLNGKNYKVSWYFLTKNNLSEHLKSDFEKAMRTMMYLGIGGERTSGCGSLTEYFEKSLDIEPVEMSNYKCSVSLIALNENELTEKLFYQTIKRGGRFLEKGKCLKMIQMLHEGAVFNTDLEGCIISLNDNPPVLRYGMNLDIPLNTNFINNEL